MAIDVFNENVLSLPQAAKRLPRVRNGKPPHVSTLYRWITAGKKCPDGLVARLECVKIGGTTCTSIEALQRYFDRITGEREVVLPRRFTSRERLRQIRKAEEELDKLGF